MTVIFSVQFITRYRYSTLNAFICKGLNYS